MCTFRNLLVFGMLALLPALASAAEPADCVLQAASISDQVKSNSARIDALEGSLGYWTASTDFGFEPQYLKDSLCSYCTDDVSSDRVYGAIAYEMRWAGQGNRSGFDQGVRLDVNYFSQLSENVCLNVGISNNIGLLPHQDPFGFAQEMQNRQTELKLTEAYVKVGE